MCDYQTYSDLFDHMSNFMKKPNIIVHLHVTPEESFERIKMRNRNCESNVPIEYLRNLYDAYEVFLQDIARVIPVIKVDYNKFRTAEEMAEKISEEYARIQNIRYVTFNDSSKTGSPMLSSRKPSMSSPIENVIPTSKMLQ